MELIIAKGHELGTFEVLKMLLARGAPPCSVHYLLKSSQTKNKAFPELIKLMIENGATVDFPENPFLEFFQHLNGRNQFVWRSFSIILEHCLLDIKSFVC